MSNELALCCESIISERQAYAKDLAYQLNLPIVTSPFPPSFSYVLMITDCHLQLCPLHDKIKPFYVDFLSREFQHRCSTNNKKTELIAKAVGIKSKERPSIIDATAGLGADSFVLANFGCEVHCLERSAVIAALLQDGINRFLSSAAQQKMAALRFSLTVTDSIGYLENLPNAEFPDVIYLDPMFPTRQKSALVKKEMRILRQMVGYDLDAPVLLAVALTRAKKRVVVKRPRLAPIIEGRNPDSVYTGQSSRFDVYIIR